MTTNNIKLIISNETVCIMQFSFFQVTFLQLEFIETLPVTLAGAVFVIFLIH